MTVYIIYIAVDSSSSIGEYHDTTIDCVYTDKDLAKKRIQELKKENPNSDTCYTHYSILERKVEA